MRRRTDPNGISGNGLRLAVVLVGAVCLGLAGCGKSAEPAWMPGIGGGACPGHKIRVIGVENQYADLVRQLGGQGVEVLAVISNPNADPHEYEANAAIARAYQQAQLVVQNGLGYDDFSNKILATISPGPKVITAGEVVGLKVGDNPHVWYNPQDVTKICGAITAALKELNPQGADYFGERAAAVEQAMIPYHEAVAEIRTHFAGIPVGATESIFVYMAQATGLDLISPPGLLNAVSEGNSPSVADVATFEQQLAEKKIRMLVFNTQTITNLTTQLEEKAKAQGIPVVGISETMTPLGTHFQDWQLRQLNAMRAALQSEGKPSAKADKSP